MLSPRTIRSSLSRLSKANASIGGGMFTSRGSWFILFVFGLLAFAVVGQFVAQVAAPNEPMRFPNLPSVALIALTLALWFIAEWFLFAVRATRLRHRLQLTRVVLDEQGPA